MLVYMYICINVLYLTIYLFFKSRAPNIIIKYNSNIEIFNIYMRKTMLYQVSIKKLLSYTYKCKKLKCVDFKAFIRLAV